MQTCNEVEHVTVAQSGRWAVSILGDDMPLESGLSRGAASRRAKDLAEELSSGATEWDWYCNIGNGDQSFILFRMIR